MNSDAATEHERCVECEEPAVVVYCDEDCLCYCQAHDPEAVAQRDLEENPYVVATSGARSLTGHTYHVLDTRTGETLGSNLSLRAASDVAQEAWTDEC